MARDVRLVYNVPRTMNINRPSGTTSVITPGQVLVIGGRALISISEINLESVNDYNNGVAIGGAVYECTADGAISANAAVWWDATNKKVTTTASTNPFFGYVTPDSSSTSDGDKIEVLHMPFDFPAGTTVTYTNATTSVAGLMSAADKTKLDGIGIATASTAGLVKPDGTTIEVSEAGAISVKSE